MGVTPAGSLVGDTGGGSPTARRHQRHLLPLIGTASSGHTFRTLNTDDLCNTDLLNRRLCLSASTVIQAAAETKLSLVAAVLVGKSSQD